MILARRAKRSFEKCDTSGDSNHPDCWQVCKGLLRKANLRHATFRGIKLMHLPNVKLPNYKQGAAFGGGGVSPLHKLLFKIVAIFFSKDVLDTTDAAQD